MEKSESAMKGREQEDEYVQKILFAAGSTLAIACFKYVLALLLVEQWRLRVFLLLNLVLLAIFFTSVHSSSSHENEASNNIDVKTNKKKKNRRADDQAGGTKGYDAHHEKIAGASGKECLTEKSDDAQEQPGEQVKDCTSSCEAPCKLSKEELNERVEAFITMFRQHLVSDARKGRNHQFLSRPKQIKSKFTLPNQGVRVLC